jgi:integrase
MRFLTADEVEDLAAAHPERYRAMVLVAAYGGFRFGELAGFRRRIGVTGTVRIEETCVEVAGDLVWGAPKTEADRRSVTLPSFVASALRDHHATYSQAGLTG